VVYKKVHIDRSLDLRAQIAENPKTHHKSSRTTYKALRQRTKKRDKSFYKHHLKMAVGVAAVTTS
jgi:hypothetical protein